ncbi:hypothetical protein PIROE2DRAFT_15759 [Piromyces sp. E2]|nr:hypothetical protein PIROE2DRAFT_15759 [Piromyces sp. E2]|eukprot:OUM58884.1 hypothetical protein PIROE2DRAFT_15759 [Piromyces sp. E2]
MNNKVRKALFKVRGFLKNPLIPIPFKRSVISSVVLGIAAYYAPLLGSNKSRTNGPQQLVNKDNCEQSLEHWLLNCSSFNEIRNDVINNLDIVHSFFNSDSRNVNSENFDYISGNNSSEIGLNNSSNEISNNSDSVNENLILTDQIENVPKHFNFLLGERRNNNRNQIEWENLCKYQLKSGNLSDIPFLAKTAAFFNKVMPIVSGQRWSSANADNTVRQANSANEHISAYAHATERNRKTLSGVQTLKYLPFNFCFQNKFLLGKIYYSLCE